MFVLLSKRLDFLPELSKTCYLLLLFSFLECAAGGIIYYLSLYLGTSTPFNKLQIGQIGAMVGLGSLIGSLGSVYILDKLNCKNIIAWSFFILSVGFYSLPQSINFLTISVCALIISATTSIFLAANNTILLENAPQDPLSLRKVQGMKVVSENLGNSCSMALIMFFAAQYYREIFEGVGLFFFLFALSALRYLSTEKNSNHLSAEQTELRKPNQRGLYFTIIGVFIIGIIYGQQRIAYPLFLNETFTSYFITATLFWLDPIMVALFQLKVTQITSSLKIHTQLALGGLLLGFGLFLLMLTHSLLGVIIACLIFILGEMLFMPTSFVYCYECAGTNQKGKASGVWRSAYYSGLIIGPLISGFLIQYFNYNACWILSGTLGLFIFILFFAKK